MRSLLAVNSGYDDFDGFDLNDTSSVLHKNYRRTLKKKSVDDNTVELSPPSEEIFNKKVVVRDERNRSRITDANLSDDQLVEETSNVVSNKSNIIEPLEGRGRKLIERSEKGRLFFNFSISSDTGGYAKKPPYTFSLEVPGDEDLSGVKIRGPGIENQELHNTPKTTTVAGYRFWGGECQCSCPCLDKQNDEEDGSQITTQFSDSKPSEKYQKFEFLNEDSQNKSNEKYDEIFESTIDGLIDNVVTEVSSRAFETEPETTSEKFDGTDYDSVTIGTTLSITDESATFLICRGNVYVSLLRTRMQVLKTE